MAHHITLIFTQHKEHGACTSDALLQIIQAVNPEVIFEELSLENYHLAYVDKTLSNLESLAIRKYLAIQEVKHVPVDTFEQPKNYYNDINFLYDKLLHSAKEHSSQIRTFIDQKESWVYRHGFNFLNSNQNEILFENLDMLKERALDMLNKENLFAIAEMEKTVLESREDVILKNIFSYCLENKFSRGLMFIGSGHQKSIKKKIQEGSKEKKINWTYYSDLIKGSN